MGKKKGRKLAAGHVRKPIRHPDRPPKNKSQQPAPSVSHASKKNAAKDNAASGTSKKGSQGSTTDKVIIPFSPEDRILLVGEGDLSFALSLVDHHYCENLTATVLEKDRDELVAKYPHAAENIDRVEAGGGMVEYGVDARKMGPWRHKKNKKKAQEVTSEGVVMASSTAAGGNAGEGKMDRIIFNFPHVGGKSTDVNRQVRHNQELLVDFFQRALLSLAPGGTIIVTLFEGEPYTLWNIRDLGRHAGMQVERSFRFDAGAYPGYHHARTLGVVRNKAGEATGGGWKGEDRAARSYIFVRKDEVAKPVSKKRKKDESSDDDDDD